MNEQLQAKVQKLLDSGQSGVDIQTALATKYSPDVANAVMRKAFEPKIASFRAKGAKDADILAAFKAKGYTFSSLDASPTAQAPDPATQVPAQAPDPTAQVPAQAPDPATQVPAQAPDPTAQVPAQAPDPTAQVPAQAPDPTAQVPAQAPDPATQVPAQAPDPTDASTLPQVGALPGDPSSDFATAAPGETGTNLKSSYKAPILANGRDAATTVATIQNLRQKYLYGAHLLSTISPEAAQELDQLKAETTDITRSELTRLGFHVTDITDGVVSVQDPVTGETSKYGGSFLDLDHFLAMAYEQAGAVMGTTAGSMIGRAAGTATLNPISGLALTVAGGMMGGYIGATFGRGADLARHANDLNYSISTQEALSSMADAGMTDALFSALGVGAQPIVSGAWRFGQRGGRALKTIYNAVVNKNSEGAIQAAMDNFNLNHVQAVSMIKEMEAKTGARLLSDTARATNKLQPEDASAVAHLTLNLPGSAKFVRDAAAASKTGGSKMLAEIIKRGKDARTEADQLANPNILAEMKDKLGLSDKSGLPATDGYMIKTKEIFAQTKQLGIDSMHEVPFKFDYVETTLLPELKKVANKIHFNVRPEFKDYLMRIQELGGTVNKATKPAKDAPKPVQILDIAGRPISSAPSAKAKEANNPNRTFADLLDLRQVINEMSGDTKFTAHLQTKQAKIALKGVDTLISKTALTQMPNGKIWLDQWKKANQEYSNMLTFKTNHIYKLLMNTKTTPDTGIALITRSMLSDSSGLSSNFMAAMAKLPVQTRKNVEGSVISHLANKAVVGHQGGIDILDFTRLEASLRPLNFTQKETRETARAIREAAKVSANDPDLAMSLGSVPLSRPSQTFATTMTGLGKRMIINYAYHKVLAKVPFSNQAGKASLANHISAVLDKPLSVRDIKSLRSDLPPDPALDTAIHQLGVEFTARGRKEHYGQVQLFRAHHAGKFNTASDTVLGKGMLYYADSTKASSIAKATEARVTEAFILRKRIATPEDAATALGRPLTDEDYRDPLTQHILQKNYAGVAKGGLVLLFK